MKRIAYSLLLIFLLSCGSKSELKGNRINVFFRDSLTIPHEYYLLFVRDSALVVAPGFYDAPGKPITIANSKINHVLHSGDGKVKAMFLGGIIGCTTAAATVGIIGIHNRGNTEGGLGIGVTAAVAAAPALVLGMIIGYNLAADEDKYNLEKEGDRYELGGYAKYPDTEPLELQKIK